MSLTLPASLAARLYLLAFNLERGKMYRVPGLGRTLRAAALTQLHQDGVLADADGVAVLAASPAEGERAPDPLTRLAGQQVAAGPARSWAHWVAHDRRAAVRIVREDLAAAGWVTLGARPDGLPRRGLTTVSIPGPQRQTVRVLNREVGRALRGEIATADLSADLAALVALGAAGDVIALVSHGEQAAWRDRIVELTRLAGPAAAALAARG